jgi:hypothetical protein
MHNKSDYDKLLKAMYKMKDDAERQRQSFLEKIFTNNNRDAALESLLSTFGKYELDNIRQSLKLQGVSSLRKAQLVSVLDKSIKEKLPSIVEKLTNMEYKLLLQIIKRDGLLQFKPKHMEIMLYLRRYGILHCVHDDNLGKCMLIPKDLIDGIKDLFLQLKVINRIKLNDKVTKIARGLLCYYGVIDTNVIGRMINSFLTEPVDLMRIYDILFESNEKDYGINFTGNCWCHDNVQDYEMILKEHSTRSTINYLPLSLQQVLDASEDNFIEWSKFDRQFCSYLYSNFEITKGEAEEFIYALKTEFNNMCSFGEAMDMISDNFILFDVQQVDEIGSLLQDMYNNSRQWALKGYSPAELSSIVNKESCP